MYFYERKVNFLYFGNFHVRFFQFNFKFCKLNVIIAF